MFSYAGLMSSVAIRAAPFGWDNPYGYIPTRYVCILFLTLFGFSTAVHFGQAIWYRMWWLLLTINLCGLLEVLGWAARLWSSINIDHSIPFTMQISCLIMGPTPLLAASFIILGRVINELGPAFSRLSPKWYMIIFYSCDCISLVIQGVGGGIASSAAADQDPQGTARGADIMLGGIVFQMATITVYAITASEFFVRYMASKPVRMNPDSKDPPFKGTFEPRLKFMCAALFLTTLVLLIRAIYRTIELTEGWGGPIITNETYFNVLDGAMTFIGMFALNVAHPGMLLRKTDRRPKNDVSMDTVA